MHASESCAASCSCSCPPCQLAGEHPRHAGPLAVLAVERDPLTVGLVDELLPAAKPAPRCCDWSSGHPPASPIAEHDHGAGDGVLVRAGLR